MNNNSIYTAEEQEQLNKIKKTRFDIIDDMTKDGPPDRSGDIRVLNEVLTSADKMIVDTANIRIKQEDAANNGAVVEMVAELLTQARSKKELCVRSESTPELPSNLANVELVHGEAVINPEPLNPESFVTPSFDASKLEE